MKTAKGIILTIFLFFIIYLIGIRIFWWQPLITLLYIVVVLLFSINYFNWFVKKYIFPKDKEQK
jgi:hypothetical protein